MFCHGRFMGSWWNKFMSCPMISQALQLKWYIDHSCVICLSFFMSHACVLMSYMLMQHLQQKKTWNIHDVTFHTIRYSLHELSLLRCAPSVVFLLQWHLHRSQSHPVLLCCRRHLHLQWHLCHLLGPVLWLWIKKQQQINDNRLYQHPTSIT